MPAKSRSKSSKRWLQEHFTDEYVKQAKKSGYRSRAVYKLIEINARDKLFKPGQCIVELGASPGSWAQWLSQKIAPGGRLIAVDLLPIEPITNVAIIQGDFAQETVLNRIITALNGQQPDWILSDMAPNVSGNTSVDIPQSMYLAELTVHFAQQYLKKGGGVLIKIFQGEGFDALLQQLKMLFTTVHIRKPKASRNRSCEIYLLARGFK